MKTTLILIITFLFSLHAFSQDFSQVDAHARNTPDSKTKTVQDLSQYLTKKFSTEQEKVRAIYVWIAENIKYNLSTIDEDNKLSIEQKKKKQLPDRVLKSRRAICEGYSNLFYEMCRLSGIHAEMVTGLTKDTDGRLNEIPHAWNIVKVDGEWFLVDNTWGAGGVDENRRKYVRNLEETYFLGKPEDFIQDHFPTDPLFQLLPNPVDYQSFINNHPVVVTQDADAGFIHFADTLAMYGALDSLGREMNSCLRTLRFDPENSYANLIMAGRHFKLGSDAYKAHLQALQALQQERKNPTNTHLETWDQQLETAKHHFSTSLALVERMRPDKQLQQNGEAMKAINQQSLEIVKKMETQVAEIRKILEKR